MYFSRQISFSRFFQDSPVYLSTVRAMGHVGAPHFLPLNFTKEL